MSHRSPLLLLLLAGACTADLADAPTGPYVAASVTAPAGALCDLHPDGDPTARTQIAVDDDGVLRFDARRANQLLDFECNDGTTGVVDLADDATFAPRPYDIARAGGADRAALTGDPMSYASDELVAKGYGLRPDPTTNPDGYQRWLDAASIPMRVVRNAHAAMLGGEQQLPQPRVQSANSPIWTGSVMSGYSGETPAQAGLPPGPGTGSYVFVEGGFTVPPVSPGLYGTGWMAAHSTIWSGINGNGTGAALIQSGIHVKVDDYVLSYSIFREFCCGLTGNLGFTTTFTPHAGDRIYTQNWYCDASGRIDLSGGYGCSYVTDVTTGQFLSCTLPNDTTCPSLPFGAGWAPGGAQAEFITEEQDPAFPGFASTISMNGTATVAFAPGVVSLGDVTKIVTSNVATDPKVTLDSITTSVGPRLTPVLSTTAPTMTELHVSSWPSMLVVENKCVNATPISGAAATLVTCNGNAYQQWVFQDNGTITPASSPSLCLDLAGGNTANGSAVVLAACTPSAASQRWTYNGNTLTGYGGKCLDNPNFVTTDGTHFDYWACNSGVNQQVLMTSAPHTLVAEGTIDRTKKCIDLPNWVTTDGTRLDLWDCNGGTNQKWVFASDGTVRSIVDVSKCIDEDGDWSGSHIQINHCTVSERWRQRWGWGVHPGTVFSGSNQLVIAVPVAGLLNGTQLYLESDPVDPNNSNQPANYENQAFSVQ